MESVTGLPDAAFADRTSFFLVMPAMPFNQQQLFPTASSYVGNWTAVGVQNNLQSYTVPAPYVIMFDRAEAHKKAQELSKQHHSPYFVAQLNVLGQYIPPPPEWKPSYQDVWAKPGSVKVIP